MKYLVYLCAVTADCVIYQAWDGEGKDVFCFSHGNQCPLKAKLLKLWLYQDKKPSWMPDYILPKMTFFVAGPQRVELSSFDYFGNP
ncbi:hypothetical protein U9M48_023126 [Paspalum notatum var. saurae]|uniref:Uncharacterized protein n=1 Tax=Paspalum notatum var. saurae TaxID=547442 RepID=A0AAQ3TJZ0_PASNO